MAHFLDHVRRKSGFTADSDDDFTINTDDEAEIAGPTSKTPRSVSTLKTPVPRKSALNTSSGTSRLPVNQLTVEDIELCQRLDEEYERALEERKIGYNARYASVRQSAVLSVCFMVAFMSLGTAFFMRQTAWTIQESMLFSIYTITTVGYGRAEMPTTPGFQAYTIFYILVGIAALTIMVAQVYQCIALEASLAQHSRDRTEMARRGLDVLKHSRRQTDSTAGRAANPGETDQDEIIVYHNQSIPGCMHQIFQLLDHMRNQFLNNEIGRGVSVIFPFAGLILLGAVVVGPIEEWTFLEALYFSVVSLTTVGFGDYVPTQNTSIIFCIFWLPFSVGFMSMYLGNVAAFYIRLSDRNIQRIERITRRRLERAKDQVELERAEVLQRAYRGQEVEIEASAALSDQGDDEKPVESAMELGQNGIPVSHAQSLARWKKPGGFNALPMSDGGDSGDFDGSDTHSLFGSNPDNSGDQRRQRIIVNNTMATQDSNRADGATMQSMGDVIRAVRSNLDATKNESTASVIRSGPDIQFMSIRSTETITTHKGVLRRVQTRKPSFALRVLVQERFAEIIATDIAGYQSAIDIKDTTMSVTIDSLKETADKWLIPRRARKPFRAVAFEVLSFVGEHGLVTRGADTLYDLSPFEFHGLFSPLIASMGDADTMEVWLEGTDVLAAADLSREERSELTPRKEADSTMRHLQRNLDSLQGVPDETRMGKLPNVPNLVSNMTTGMA